MMYLKFYSRKEQRLETIALVPIADGWYIFHDCYRGIVDPTGNPHLWRCLEENYSHYPSTFPDSFKKIWEVLKEERLDPNKIQMSLDRLSKWLQAYEKDQNIKLSDIR